MLIDQDSYTLSQLNLSIAGHVDSRNSTRSGQRILCICVAVWGLDERADERERGITMTVSVAYFSTMLFY
ncbi:hypothetical protein DY000_02023086 [Brassica cretica]|uniref:Uncharacterized protein n=1 Tax=Brassica cretica TaxID=69181 RepID=A0ABQ7EK86_BRACR|nr:hypothetical protein DY000_02023086 [Brassica cretica]